jgi:UDP-GlcNAc:undecaprenyl-phosphate/decaprenyl-phosphate GlcNAc-1-phosphate transferase
MTLETLVTVLLAALGGHAAASVLVPLRLRAPDQRLVRTNVSGRRVPAVLGGPLVLAGLFALAGIAVAVALGWEHVDTGAPGVALTIVVVVLALAGSMDDRRGDETDRGFSGHLQALRKGRLTGGILKIVAGALGGGLAGLLLYGDDVAAAAATLLLVALGANAINLFDRAPGRAGKVALLLATPLVAFGDAGWAMSAAGLVGALVACLPFDLGERAMLGDAGANPLGGAIGLGLALSLGGTGRWVAVAVLLALNLASEHWSFSTLISSTPWLNRLDQLGRR